MNEVYETLKALAISNKIKGTSKETQKTGMSAIFDAVLDEVYDK